jgi:hypothetical protein
MSDGEVPLGAFGAACRGAVTESSLEEPTTGMGIQAGANEYQRCEASGHDRLAHVGQIFDLSFHSHAAGLLRTRDV